MWICVCNRKWGSLCWTIDLRKVELKREESSCWFYQVLGGTDRVAGSFIAAAVKSGHAEMPDKLLFVWDLRAEVKMFWSFILKTSVLSY